MEAKKAETERAKVANVEAHTPVRTETPVSQRPTKVYLRLPNMSGEIYRKAFNLVSIFDGDVSVILYDTSSKKYLSTGVGISATPYVISQLRNILGEENVVLK